MTTPVHSPEAPGFLAPRAADPLDHTLSIPGSKSLTNRELVLAALADGSGVVARPLHSDDSARMVDALRALGVGIEELPGGNPFGPDLLITPSPLTGGEVDSGQAGTVMRFITPLAGLASGDVHVTAHASALHRPMGTMISALRDLGVDIDDGGRWALPVMVHGRSHVRGGDLTIDASGSSQFVSGLLLAAPRFDVGLRLRHQGPTLPSVPHIDMTIETLSRRGVLVERAGGTEWIVQAGPIRAKDVVIEPDLSNAAPFLAAALVVGGQVTVTGWPAHSTQPGAHLPELLEAFGARARRRGGELTVTGGRRVCAVDLDLSAVGELTPTLVGIAAFADGPSTFRGIAHLRGHETDRLAALVANLRAIGGDAEELPDGIRVIPRPLSGGVWRAFHDHRIATTGVLIGLAAPNVVVDDIGSTAKTLPEFVDLWRRMVEGE
ncbi:MAG: 3-phosphoshikimate 1-carboxyvinyltransferase [Microbacterium sp.]